MIIERNLRASPSGRSARRCLVKREISTAPNKPVYGSAFEILVGLRLRVARMRSLWLSHIALASEHTNPKSCVRFIGSGNVVNRRPLGAIWSLDLSLKRFRAILGAQSIVEYTIKIIQKFDIFSRIVLNFIVEYVCANNLDVLWYFN
jgi:hypothetical protein